MQATLSPLTGRGLLPWIACTGALCEPAEIVVTCAGGRPKDLNLFQAQKALDNAKNAALPGGSIILVAECSEGLGHPVFERWASEATSAEDCWERFGREYEFGGHKAAFLAKESMQHHLILVSALPRERQRCASSLRRQLLSRPWSWPGRGRAGMRACWSCRMEI